MTKHRAVVTGYDPDFENPDQTTGRPKGVQTAADMRVSTTFDVLGEGIFALHGVPQVIASPLDTIEITPFMAAIESPLGGFYIIKTTENETVEINLANAGAVKVYVQQQDWELENDLAHADSAVVFGVAYGAAEIPEGALLLFSSTIVAQTSTSGLTFAQEFKWTGAASGQIRVPNVSDLDDITELVAGMRGLVLGDGGGEFIYVSGNWEAVSPAAGLGVPTGVTAPFAGANAPDGWLFARGQAVSRSTYENLFAVIGTLYGSGNGSTTFNLPDLRGRVAVGMDTAQTEFDTLGKSVGEKSHNHTLEAGHAKLTLGAYIYQRDKAEGGGNFNRRASITTAENNTGNLGTTTALGGSTDGGGTIQPSLSLNYLIKT